jgi:WD40 repeat protein
MNAVAFSPDGEHIICHTLMNTLCIYNAKSGTEIFSRDGHPDVVCFTLSRQGNYFQGQDKTGDVICLRRHKPGE